MEKIIKAKCHKKIKDTYFIVIKSQNKRQYLSKYKKGDTFILWKNNEIHLDLESLNKMNEIYIPLHMHYEKGSIGDSILKTKDAVKRAEG